MTKTRKTYRIRIKLKKGEQSWVQFQPTQLFRLVDLRFIDVDPSSGNEGNRFKVTVQYVRVSNVILTMFGDVPVCHPSQTICADIISYLADREVVAEFDGCELTPIEVNASYGK